MVQHADIDHTGITGTGTGGSGTIVQVVTAVSTTKDDTTSATFVDSSLSLAITPTFSTSILIIEVSGLCTARRVAGTILERMSIVAIRNVTDAVIVTQSNRGQFLVATNAAEGAQYCAIALRGRYTVNSLTARTFRLQHAAGVVTNVESSIRGDVTGGVLMTITEIAP